MNIIEKRDYIHNHLSQVNDKIIDEFFEKLRSFFEKESVLQSKLESRAKKSEKNIKAGKIYSREEIEKRTNQIGQ
ncbi:MAG: hypothetical protein ACQERU_05990 [Bacteroidota bacterium]